MTIETVLDDLKLQEMQLRKVIALYRRTGEKHEPWDVKDWADSEVIHVCFAKKPRGELFQAGMRNIAGFALHKSCNVVEVRYGTGYVDPDGNYSGDSWVCFARLRKAA